MGPSPVSSLRQIALSADYLGLSLRDRRSGRVSIDELELPADLVAELRGWNDRYQPIILRDAVDWSSGQVADLIASLDREGLALAERIGEALGATFSVRYFSEGHITYLL